MTIVWKTTEISIGAVEWGEALDEIDSATPSGTAGFQHAVTLTGLKPGTRYYYRVVVNGQTLAGGDASYSFRTSPPVGSAAKFRAWIVGDSGTGSARQIAVRDVMARHVGRDRPHLYLHMGDMAYSSGTHDEFTANFYAIYADILRQTPIWPTLGNHEGFTATSATQSGPYYESYVLPVSGESGGLASGTEAYYSFDYANVHFVVLDSYDSSRIPGGAMLTWLANDLMSTSQEWTVAYWHHPPYTKGSHDSDIELAHIEMRENALPLLEGHGVDLVLGGHSHIYERSYLLDGAYKTPSLPGVGILDDRDGRVSGDGPYTKPPGASGHRGAIYAVAGHGGASVSKSADHPLMFSAEAANGSCLLDIQGNRLSLINVRADGVVSDRVSMIKGDGIVVASPDGAEVLLAAEKRPIQWVTVGDIPSVRLEYSVNDGGNWSVITPFAPNTGSYEWLVPDAEIDHMLVRVSDSRHPSVNDESNGGFAVSRRVTTMVPINFGSEWRYHDRGEDLGETWLAADYDDSGWAKGAAQLGYGEGDEITVLLDSDPNHPSVYFRTTIDLSGVQVVDAGITALYDDGVAVWVNGHRVFGVNVDHGVQYPQWSSAVVDDNQVVSGPADPFVFVEGTNVVTAMVKQEAKDSDDLSFDLRMTLRVRDAPIPPGGGDTGGGGGATSGNSGHDGETSADSSPADGNDGPESQGATSSVASGGISAGYPSCRCRSSGGTEAPRFLWGMGGLLLLISYRRRFP